MIVAAAKDIRLDAAVVAVLLQPDGTFTLKEKEKKNKKMAVKAFLGGQGFTFALFTTGLGEKEWPTPNVTHCTSWKPPAVASLLNWRLRLRFTQSPSIQSSFVVVVLLNGPHFPNVVIPRWIHGIKSFSCVGLLCSTFKMHLAKLLEFRRLCLLARLN